MVEFVFLFLVVYLAFGMMLAVCYQWFIRRNILQRVREAGGELLQMQRLNGQPVLSRPTRQRQTRLAGAYYVVKYRTEAGHELTRMCKLSPFGGVFWYDEE